VVAPFFWGWWSFVTAGTILRVPRERTRMSERTRKHVFVSGTVQGVYFRATTRDEARQRGVDGWVRNLEDGRVEAVFEGPQDAVDEMVAFCHEGSSAARVEDVEVTDEEPQGREGFRVRR
jgi:acylphosphatase